jgi:uncharacterized phage protein gp47/JayE
LFNTVANEFRNAFGADLSVTPDTPQGVLITGETLARDAIVRNNAALANQINPNIAGGIFLDAICALTGLQRDKATKSTVLCELTGVAGTLIPAGVRARTSAEALFESIGDVIIQVDGTASIVFQSVEFGAIAAPTGTLNIIVDGVLGWDTISNPDSAILGQEEQSDLSLRALRRQTLALQGTALAEAIVSAVLNVPEVKSMSFRENVAATTQTIDTISMVAHSVYACVDGGTDNDVAYALLSNKSSGAAWNGGVTVNVLEPASGQTYAVKFDRPDPQRIEVEITVKSQNAFIEPISATKNAILAYANGEIEGENGLTVGQDVSPFELSGAVNRQYPEIYVQLVRIRKHGGGSFSTNTVTIEIDEIATIVANDIVVTVV